MQSQLECKKLLVKKSPVHGYGVFADQDINPGEIIEEAYSIVLPKGNFTLNYFLFGNKGYKNILSFGYGCIYNHSRQPNAIFEYDAERSIIIYSASSAIKKGEEIFISYGKHWFDKRNLRCKPISFSYSMRSLGVPLLRFTLVVGGVYTMIALLNIVHMPV